MPEFKNCFRILETSKRKNNGVYDLFLILSIQPHQIGLKNKSQRYLTYLTCIAFSLTT
jgi:hypothetical protein